MRREKAGEPVGFGFINNHSCLIEISLLAAFLDTYTVRLLYVHILSTPKLLTARRSLE